MLTKLLFSDNTFDEYDTECTDRFAKMSLCDLALVYIQSIIIMKIKKQAYPFHS